MAIDKELIRTVREMDEYNLRRLAMLVKGELIQKGAWIEDSGEPEGAGNVGYRLEHVRCGKRGCRTCPHGPYWYAYWREGGKLRTRYIGKSLPEGIEPPSRKEPA